MKNSANKRSGGRSGLLAVCLLLASALAGCPEAKVNDDLGGDACIGAACNSDTFRPPDDAFADLGGRDTGICTPNACGGCTVLEGRPNDSCGTCGRYACDGTDAVMCEEGVGNACGGCQALTQVPGDPCGTCGEYACDGADAVSCDESTSTNSCGGCNELQGVKDASCGDCGNGAWTCLSPNSIVCQGDTSNPCGGCVTLPARPGDACGTCGGGAYVCDDTDAVLCQNGEQTNPCGGCGQLVGTIDDPCGDCLDGALQCAPDNASLTCVGASACDPCAPSGGSDGNDTVATATHLGDYDDGDNSWIPHRDSLFSELDVDVFSAHVDDGAFATLDIVAELTDLSVDYDLCVFWERDDQDTTSVWCPDGDFATLDGLEGCCSLNLDANPEFVNLADDTGGAGIDDSGTVYYIVFTYGATGCFEYELAFAF